MTKYDKDYDYVALKEPTDERLTFSATDRFMAERATRLSSAKRAYLRIMEAFSTDGAKRRSQRQAVKLRAENQRRHDHAASLGHWPMGRTS